MVSEPGIRFYEGEKESICTRVNAICARLCCDGVCTKKIKIDQPRIDSKSNKNLVLMVVNGFLSNLILFNDENSDF